MNYKHDFNAISGASAESRSALDLRREKRETELHQDQGVVMGNIDLEGDSLAGRIASDTVKMAQNLMFQERDEKKRQKHTLNMQLDLLRERASELRERIFEMKQEYAQLEEEVDEHLRNINRIHELLAMGQDGEYDENEREAISDFLGMSVSGMSKRQIDTLLREREREEAQEVEKKQSRMEDLAEKINQNQRELDRVEAAIDKLETSGEPLQDEELDDLLRNDEGLVAATNVQIAQVDSEKRGELDKKVSEKDLGSREQEGAIDPNIQPF